MNAAPEGIKYGIFDWIDRNDGLDLREIYEQRLRMLEYADEAGIWAYHLAEHHGTPLGMSPSPNLFLAAAAQRTSRLRLGPMVQLLPLYNPIRNIEEVCILDALSNGRLELGVGRGISADELAIYGVDSAETRERFQECFDILLMGLSTGRVDYQGRYYTVKDAPLHVRPVQQPYPPLWYPSSSPDRTTWVAQHGFNTLFGFTRTALESIAQGVKQYRAAYAEASADSQRLNPQVREPLLGATRHVFVAASDTEAESVARRAYTAFDRNYVDRPAGALNGGQSRRGDYDTAVSWGGILAGSPETVRKQVQHFVTETGANYFCGTFAFGDLTTAQILTSMRLFAEEVMPAVTPAVVASG
jgi:alkanesulfonate monooxygenase SsuD/methylene tetrahydromethanopterin reductase-like flavin-dependent oxidoreductase (luciferase family)